MNFFQEKIENSVSAKPFLRFFAETERATTIVSVSSVYLHGGWNRSAKPRSI